MSLSISVVFHCIIPNHLFFFWADFSRVFFFFFFSLSDLVFFCICVCKCCWWCPFSPFCRTLRCSSIFFFLWFLQHTAFGRNLYYCFRIVLHPVSVCVVLTDFNKEFFCIKHYDFAVGRRFEHALSLYCLSDGFVSFHSLSKCEEHAMLSLLPTLSNRTVDISLPSRAWAHPAPNCHSKNFFWTIFNVQFVQATTNQIHIHIIFNNRNIIWAENVRKSQSDFKYFTMNCGDK